MWSSKVSLQSYECQFHVSGVCADDFEVSIFLTEISTRHSLLVKSKTFKAKDFGDNPLRDLPSNDDDPVVIREDSDGEDEAALADILSVDSDNSEVMEPPTKRQKQRASGDHESDDKKKLGFQTSYNGFSIWGWVLCLLVERKGVPGKRSDDTSAQALMQEWISSQQQAEE
jgi:hypothetical protein